MNTHKLTNRYTHTHKHIIHTYIHINTYTRPRTQTNTRIQTHTYPHINTFTHTKRYARTFARKYTRNTQTYKYQHTHTHTHTQTHAQHKNQRLATSTTIKTMWTDLRFLLLIPVYIDRGRDGFCKGKANSDVERDLRMQPWTAFASAREPLSTYPRTARFMLDMIRSGTGTCKAFFSNFWAFECVMPAFIIRLTIQLSPLPAINTYKYERVL